MSASRADRLRRLAASLPVRIEAEYSASTHGWTFVWTDGPTAAFVRRAAQEAEPDLTEGLRYVRRYAEETVALGAVRLTVATCAAEARHRPVISPAAVEEFWRHVSLPIPSTDRERLLVYAVIYEVRDGHHRNRAYDHEICDMIGRYGLAPLLRRAGGELTPIEALTDHYASTHAHPAWRFRLAPMTAAAAFDAVRDDPKASQELIAAALTLLPELPGTSAAELRARLFG
ncbi:hypothetical protein OG596_00520 [Streptomyces sp. NBC_01102]|uniref:hypothetical protein n=1 Tax=unclassified Streptomyces TaxID=2593676 RepID=UPI003865F90A|nr:hypothetical protein OG596_00520 [Streptomyces sp. NBC_01102]